MVGPNGEQVGIVRVGRHSGYDRVVWEFPGAGLPTYRVRYVDTPIADGSGDGEWPRRRLAANGLPRRAFHGVANPADASTSAPSSERTCSTKARAAAGFSDSVSVVMG